VIIIGAGNMAWHLGYNFLANGVNVAAICSRTESRGKALAESLGAVYSTAYIDIGRKADLVILAVSDDEIENVASSLGFLSSEILIHTAGAVSIDVLSSRAVFYGVIYPLQTLTAGRKLDFRNIPLMIEASNQNVYEKLVKFSARLSDRVYEMSSEDRMILHLSAVISSNFSNHLLSLSEKILQDHGISFSLLKPLLEETVSKAFEAGPALSQTGPAVRGNRKVIEKHLLLLEKYPEIAPLYKILSESIKSKYKNNNSNEI
jgi:predicted short-subunit dehydrogenase-like oxidoreductase (DUF2520 family)